MAFDFKKEYKDLYQPKTVPSIVTVPPMRFIAVRGAGDPNEPDGDYQRALNLLYGVAYTLRRDECLRIPALDAQRREGKSVFGSGYLLSSRAAAERAAATFWQLSAREKAMIEYLDGKEAAKS